MSMGEFEEKNKKDDSPALKNAADTTRRQFKKLWKIVSAHTGFDKLVADAQRGSSVRPPKSPGRHSLVLILLQLVPWLLAALFIISFFWDFEGFAIGLPGFRYPLDGLLRIISISGLIGFLTNWIAITMLFRPSKKRPLLGHGLIPAHKERIAFRLASAVSEDLINPEIIKRKIHDSGIITRYREKSLDWFKNIIDDPDFRTDIKNWVVEYSNDILADPDIRSNLARQVISEIDEALVNRSLEKAALKTYTFLRGREMQDIIEDAIAEIPSAVEKGLNNLDHVLDKLPEKIDKQGETIEEVVTILLYKLINQLDVHALVEDNLKNYDEGRLENMIRGATNEQLRYIQYLGAVLGTIGGFVIWQPVVSLSLILVLLLILYSADFLIGKFHPDTGNQ